MATVIAAAIATSLAGARVSRCASPQVDGHSMLTAAFNGAGEPHVHGGRCRRGRGSAHQSGRLGDAGWRRTCGRWGTLPLTSPPHGIVDRSGQRLRSGRLRDRWVKRSTGLDWFAVTLLVPALFPEGPASRATMAGGCGPAFVLIAVGAVLDPLFDTLPPVRNDLKATGRTPVSPDGASPRGGPGHTFLIHVPLSLVATVGVVTLLLHRWRRGTALQRQQLQCLGWPRRFRSSPHRSLLRVAGGWVLSLAALPLPFAIGFAVLARGLYDLRTAANRTLVWVTISAVVAAIYAFSSRAGPRCSTVGGASGSRGPRRLLSRSLRAAARHVTARGQPTDFRTMGRALRRARRTGSATRGNRRCRWPAGGRCRRTAGLGLERWRAATSRSSHGR